MAKKIVILLLIMEIFCFSKTDYCYDLGSMVIRSLNGCELTKAAEEKYYYTCDNGSADIFKSGNAVYALNDSRGSLMVVVFSDNSDCAVSHLDEFGVADIPLGSTGASRNKHKLYLMFKKKFMGNPNNKCPASWQDANGLCDSRYFE